MSEPVDKLAVAILAAAQDEFDREVLHCVRCGALLDISTVLSTFPPEVVKAGERTVLHQGCLLCSTYIDNYLP